MDPGGANTTGTGASPVGYLLGRGLVWVYQRRKGGGFPWGETSQKNPRSYGVYKWKKNKPPKDNVIARFLIFFLGQGGGKGRGVCGWWDG